MPLFTFPHIFKDGVGETASGAQLMENLELLKTQLEALQTGATLAPRTEHAFNTGIVASATHKVYVTADVQLEPTPGFGADVVFRVNGQVVAELFQGETSSGSVRSSVSFPVPAGQEWRADTGEPKKAGTLHASYAL